MAAEVPGEFNLFGTPLTESDFIINENKLVINENLDYSVMVKCETMDFTPCNIEQVRAPDVKDENPDTVADFGHHPLLETGDSHSNTTIMLEVVRSDRHPP